MHVLICPDSFKGSLSSVSVCAALAAGISDSGKKVQLSLSPMADGGEGTLSVIGPYLEGETITIRVKDPLFRNVIASYLKVNETAYIEMALASGLNLIRPSQRNPEFTTSYGTGQLIKHAVRNGCTKVYLFVGGTATNDGGMGIGQALGFSFFDEKGEELLAIGQSLKHIARIQSPEKQLDFEMIVCTDVQNLLLGEKGSVKVYASQKGADTAMTGRLEEGLTHFAEQIKQDLGLEIKNVPGGGAGGGAAAGALAFCKAELVAATNFIFELTDLESKIKAADLIISGEGALDGQTFSGKLVSGVAGLAQKHKTPLWLVCGQHKLREAEKEALHAEKIFAVIDIAYNETDAMQNAAEYLKAIGREMAGFLQ